MPLSSTALFNNFSGTKSAVSEKSIPDYSILFWHNIENWNDVNSTHGTAPTWRNGDRLNHFIMHPLAQPNVPDINAPAVRTDYFYTVRCVSSNTNWTSSCDLTYGPNTNMSALQSTLLDVGGAHGVNLPGRTFPPLPNDSGTTFTVVNITLYNATHIGHTHQVEGLYDSLTSIHSGLREYTNNRNDISKFFPKTFASFFVTPILKDPNTYLPPVKKIPKNIIVMYYGESSLPLDYYDQYDNSIDSSKERSANGYCLPITFAYTNSGDYTLDPQISLSQTNSNTGFYSYRTGVNNLETISNTIFTSKDNSSFISKNANIISLVVSSNGAGYHDHRVLGIQSRLISSPTSIAYTVIPNAGRATIYVPPASPEPYPNGPDALEHRHTVTYKMELKLKANKLKAYLSKSQNAPIVNGLIIGYSIGKHSGFNGSETSGADTLPKGWYFCDGTNGTPDLRGRYPFLNFTQDGLTGVNENATSQIEIKEIEVETVDWKHGHVYKTAGSLPVAGNAGARDVGSHASNYDPSADPNNTTRHGHVISTAGTFTQKSPTGANLLNRPNAKVGSTYNYEPPTVEIAFIMYNDTI